MTTEINWRKSTPSWGKELAEHPDTSTYALSELAAHDDVEVRTAVADQKNTLTETMMILAQDVSADLKYAIAENHNIHADVLNMLTEDDNPFVADRAKKTLDRIRTYSLLSFPVTKVEPLSA
jgi:hypothetical protein